MNGSPGWALGRLQIVCRQGTKGRRCTCRRILDGLGLNFYISCVWLLGCVLNLLFTNSSPVWARGLFLKLPKGYARPKVQISPNTWRIEITSLHMVCMATGLPTSSFGSSVWARGRLQGCRTGTKCQKWICGRILDGTGLHLFITLIWLLGCSLNMSVTTRSSVWYLGPVPENVQGRKCEYFT